MRPRSSRDRTQIDKLLSTFEMTRRRWWCVSEPYTYTIEAEKTSVKCTIEKCFVFERNPVLLRWKRVCNINIHLILPSVGCDVPLCCVHFLACTTNNFSFPFAWLANDTKRKSACNVRCNWRCQRNNRNRIFRTPHAVQTRQIGKLRFIFVES